MKSKKKTIRVVLQLLFLVVTGGWIAYVIIDRSSPDPQHPEEWSQKDGFLALSYGALSRERGSPNMHRSLFRRHLRALRDAGYEAVTTANLVDFYQNGAPLPEKAVYLMFEGGRRDSAIYGQEALAQTGMRATMFIHTGLISSWNRTILSHSQIQYLGKSDFWDIGLSGRNVYIPSAGTDDKPRFYLSGYLPAYGDHPEETASDFHRRALEDYAGGVRDLETLTMHRPEAFIFWPANSLGGFSMDPAISAINRGLIARHFSLAFTREGPGYNHRSAGPLELTRMRVAPDCQPDELLRAMASWLPVRQPYAYRGPKDETRWRTEIGTAAFRPHSLSLSGEAGRTLVWLIGSEGWRNAECSVSVNAEPGTAASLYLRYASREEFVRLQIRDGTLLLQERLPGHGLMTLYTRELAAGSKPLLTVRLKNRRLRFLIDGVSPTKSSFSISQAQAGKLALEAHGTERDGFGAVFSELSAVPVPESWAIPPVAASLETAADEAGITGVMVDLTATVSSEDLAARLLRAADGGLERFAVLPPERFTWPESLSPGSEILPEGFIARLWSGVVFSPGTSSTARDLLGAVEAARAAGLKTAVMATPKQAEHLAFGSEAPPFDFVLVAFPEALTREADTRLRRRHAILYAKDGTRYEERVGP